MPATSSLNDRHKDFFEQVYAVVRLIPEGRVTNFGSIAKYLGTGKSSRMVGWAMNACHNHPDVPAHRVVNRVGLLSGKAHFGENRMQELLESEDVEVKDDKVVRFKELYWNPVTELAI